MKKEKKIKNLHKLLILLISLAIITTASLAIYKTIFNGEAESKLGNIIIDLKSEDNVSEINIDPLNTMYEYKFSVSNFKTENGNVKINQVLCNYYIYITQLEASISVEAKLYYINEDGTKTELTRELTGEFENYYKAPVNLEYEAQKTQNYILEFSKKEVIAEDALIYFNIDLGYTQNIDKEDYVNPPDLADGMIPIVYNEATNKWQTISKTDNNWYNYNDKKWANVATVSNYDTYNNTTGVDINYEDITSMFVWIPRFVYRIPTESYHQTVTNESLEEDMSKENLIDIHFSKPKDQGGDFWDTEILVVNAGEASINSYEAWTTNQAFNFGDTYLNGLWIAKFHVSNLDEEVASNSKIKNLTIAPAAIVQTGINYIDAFSECRNMENQEKSGSIYRWATSSEIQEDGTFSIDTNNMDIHMLKNSEYATFAYFTHSKYGLNKKNLHEYIEENGEKYMSYAGSYNTAEGVFTKNNTLSTTGNVYGIYDVPSKTWDMVCAYIGEAEKYGAGIIYTADKKYKDIYISSTETTDYTSKDSVYRVFKDIKGAGIWETSTNGNDSITAWFNGRSNIGLYDGKYYQLFLTRGGSIQAADGKKLTSIFSFGYGYAKEYADSRSFRPAIAVGQGL